MTDPIDRRTFGRGLLATIVSTTLLDVALGAEAIAGVLRPEIVRWRAELSEVCADLKRGSIPALEWQRRIEALHARVPLADLLEHIEFERLVDGIDYPRDRGAIRDVRLPPIDGVPESTVRGSKVFAYRKGAATAPHAHNGMVSAHLVLRGTFHVRTYERVGDEPEHLLIRPTVDDERGPGATVTMSDEWDNVHWFLATSDHAYTLDIPLTGVYPDKRYATAANRYGMIYLDPAGERLGDGTIRAPRLGFAEALARYGSAHVD